MKKKILFIIMCLLFIPSVNAKTYTNYNIGDLVTLSKGTDTTSQWRVIETSGSNKDTVKLFKETNVIESIAFDEKGKTAIYENSSIKTHVDQYGLLLNLGDDLEKFSLISVEELNALGCKTWTCKNAPTWVYSSFYWISTPDTQPGSYAYRVSIFKDITPVATWDKKIGMRPVIVVSKDAIQGGYKNDERTFDSIDITCDKELKSGQEFECIIKIDKLVQSMKFDLKIEGLSILEEYVIENATWNEDLDIRGEYEKEGISLTKLSGQEDSDVLLKISGVSKSLKEDSKIKFTFKNIKLYDNLGDYQNIDSIEKELIFAKEKVQEVIKNPKTGIGSIILILIILSIFGGLTYFVVNKYSKKNTL